MQTSLTTKTVYFIRHGQSEGNIKRVFQDEGDPLSALGREQARLVAEKVKTLDGEVILASPMVRAIETAKAIQNATGLPLERSDGLREYMVPSSLFNTPIISEESDKFHRALFEHIEDPEWRYADEDSYYDLHERATDVLNHIAKRDEKTILVVTHGAFMCILLSAMITEGKADGIGATRLFRFLRQENTGITKCLYRETTHNANNWRLTVWNDYSHLDNLDSTIF